MKFKASIFLLLAVCGSYSFADFEALTVTSKVAEDGKRELCVKPFPALRSTQPECLVVTKLIDRPLTTNDPTLKLTELNLEAWGVESSPGQIRFGAVIQWRGKGAGLLSISGPQGHIFAVGRVLQDDSVPTQSHVIIEQLSDESLSQQFDRAVMFGESDPIRLHTKTKIWLEEILAPIIEQSLRPPEIQSQP